MSYKPLIAKGFIGPVSVEVSLEDDCYLYYVDDSYVTASHDTDEYYEA